MVDLIEPPCLADMLVRNALQYPDVLAYRDGAQAVTHKSLLQRATDVARALAAANVTAADRVAILGRNSIDFGIVAAATQLTGIVLAPISFRSSPAELRDVLRRVAPKFVFCDPEFLAVIADAVDELVVLPEVVCLGRVRDRPNLADFSRRVSDVSTPISPARADDIACLLFTSGTTGAAKCCVIGHQEMYQIAQTMNAEMRTGCADRALINMPMFHIGALAIIGGIHARGGTVVLQSQFDVREAVQLVREHAITLLHLAPAMLRQLLAEGGETSALASVRTVVYSAAPMTNDILGDAQRAMPSTGFLNLYGQTETIVSGLPRELHDVGEHGPDLLASVGFPFRGVDVRIVDDDGGDVPAGCAGEIVVRSDMAFRGYWDDPEANRTSFHGAWYRTGDVGRMNDRGMLYLVDRKKDVIISGGENIYSPEVEEAVLSLAQVQQCAVIGVPDKKWGETVCAVVVPHDGAVVELGAVAAAVRARLSSFKVPRRLSVVSALPMLPSGKVDKKRLRAAYVDQAAPGCP